MNNYKRQVSKLIFYLFLLFNISGATLYGADLHAILVSDTTDDSIGMSVAVDLVIMEQELNDISRFTGLRLTKTVISGKHVLTKNLQKAITDLKVNPDDVVIFHASSHGYRSYSKKSRWPCIYFSLENKGIDLDDVVDKLKLKTPRLLIVLSDVCNSYIQDWATPPLVVLKKWTSSYLDAIKTENYKKLFLKSRGVIIATGSSKGQYSYCTDNSGGLFTYTLLTNLKSGVEDLEGVSWEYLFAKTRMSVMNIESTQVPDYDLQVK